MQTTLNPSFWQSARFSGILRYQRKALGKTLGLVFLIMLASQLVALVFPLVFDTTFPFTGVYVDMSLTMLVALVCSCVAAGKSTRFLLRFGTSRFAVWLGNLLSLAVGMVAFLIGTLLLNMLLGALTMALAGVMPEHYQIHQFVGGLSGSAFYVKTLQDTLLTLPQNILYTVEWTSLFYLLGTCLRRNRTATLFVVIGVPMLLMVMMLFPSARQAAEVVQSEDNQQIMLLGLQWITFFANVARFIQQEWPVIQFGAAVASLPLSYLCMRNTAQP